MYERRQAIPIIYVRGTHYDVGYDVVRRVKWWDIEKVIQERLDKHVVAPIMSYVMEIF